MIVIYIIITTIIVIIIGIIIAIAIASIVTCGRAAPQGSPVPASCSRSTTAQASAPRAQTTWVTRHSKAAAFRSRRRDSDSSLSPLSTSITFCYYYHYYYYHHHHHHSYYYYYHYYYCYHYHHYYYHHNNHQHHHDY